MNRKYVVVGGGLAGLTAAIELATHGHAVSVYEQSKSLGGRAATHRQQNYAVNLGPHAFYRAGTMKRQFDAWGISYSGNVPAGRGESLLIANGAKFRFPVSLSGLLHCGAFSAADKLTLGLIMAKFPKAKAAAGESMQAWINRLSTKPKVRQFLGTLTRVSTYCADLDQLDANAAISQIQLALKASVLYLDGGWQTLIDGLSAKAQSLGVNIHIDSGAVAVSPGAIQLRDGTQITTDGIVLAIPPRAVEQLTGQKLPTLIPARAACLDLGLRNLPRHAATFALGLDEPTYISVHSAYAARLAPPSGALVQLAMYLKQGAKCTREELERRADLIIPGWRDEVEFARFLPDMTVVHAIPGVRHKRPEVTELTPVLPSVYLAGDWIGPEAMLADAAVASGLRAARCLIQTVAIGKAA